VENEPSRRAAEVGDETSLARRACAGDPQAFSRIVERYQRPVFHLCYRYLPGPDAEDLAQETFVRAFVGRERFDPERPFLPWLLVIARNLCLDRLRERRRELGPDGDISTLPDRLPSAEEAAAGRQDLRLLARGMRELPEGQREAVALYHFEGLSYREMARSLDVPVGTVMTWLHRGRARLREMLTRGSENVRTTLGDRRDT
jgi:RNA polymerase sigma-70 factor (ECF subfamily)